MSKHAYVKAYPQEFRDKVVKLVQVGDRSHREVAEECGIMRDLDGFGPALDEAGRTGPGLGRQGVTRQKRRCTTRRDPDAAVAPDRVRRRFEAAQPERLWVADITYVRTWKGSCTWRRCWTCSVARWRAGR